MASTLTTEALEPLRRIRAFAKNAVAESLDDIAMFLFAASLAVHSLCESR